jgi:hypothetical protein
MVIILLKVSIWFEVPKFTFVEDRAKEPDVACSENMVLIALASIASPE